MNVGNFFEWLGSLWGKVFAFTIMVGLMSTKAMAQVEPPEPAELGDIVFPITLSSIALAVAAAGGTMIGLWAVYKIGFKLVRKFISRMGSTV
ncbi:MAG: hypothetical protein JJ916_12350 [Phycisphaerales bacterium]|nr:hypothetical protein [Phycisphaerales bacterium]